MIIAHKIALDPNNAQATSLARAAGVARFAYNWALAEWPRQYAAWKADNTLPKPSQAALRRQLNAVKREQFPWMLEVTKNAPQMAIIQLGQAFQNFFAGRARYPQFRRKGLHDRFSLSNDQFGLDGSRMRIPNLGWVRLRETLRLTGKIVSATVSRVADTWFVAIAVDTQDDSHLPPAENQGAVGVDLGIKALLGRLHARIAQIRSNALHQLTTQLTRRFHTVGIEDLNVRGMVKNRRLARCVADMGWFEFRRQLQYKAAMRGGVVVVADRWFASSKTCSGCGHKLDTLPLSTRQWPCPACGQTHDRDVNAAINLKHLAVSSTVAACGEDGAGLRRKTQAKPASVKQEVSVVPV